MLLKPRGLCPVLRPPEQTQRHSQPHILHPELQLESLGEFASFSSSRPGSGDAGGRLGRLGTFPWQMPPDGTSLFGEWELRARVPLEQRAWVRGMHYWDVPYRKRLRARQWEIQCAGLPSLTPQSSAPLGTHPPEPLRPPLQSLQCGEGHPGCVPLPPMAGGYGGAGWGWACPARERETCTLLQQVQTPRLPLSSPEPLLEACATTRPPTQISHSECLIQTRIPSQT